MNRQSSISSNFIDKNIYTNKNDADLGFENLDDFDMFDITTGNIISCDNTAPRYDTSIRWDSSVNAKLEKSVHELDNNRFRFQSPCINSIVPPTTNFSTLNIDPQQQNNNKIEINVQTTTTPPPSSTSPSSPLPPASLSIDMNHKQQLTPKDIVECKDMNSQSKISQLQPYVNEVFDVSCVRFYTLIIDSDFWGLVSKEMGFMEMNEGQWQTSPLECHQERVLSFKTPISFKIGPKVATVTQVQKIRRTQTNGYFMETSSVSRDVPYGDNFSVENYISLEPEGQDKSVLRVSTAVKFTKSIWGLTNIIEKTVIQSNKDFFQVWSSMAKKRILEKQHQLMQQSISQSQFQPSTETSPYTSNCSSTVSSSSQSNHTHTHTFNADKEIQKSMDYEELKAMFIKLFKEVECQQQPRVIKIVSVLTNQHISNLTIQYKHTVCDIIQYYIPFTLPNLHPGQYFELFWLDKKNEFSQFFYKDMTQPIFNYVNNVDSIGICTVTEFQALKKSLSFVIMEPGKRAQIKYNKDLDKCPPF
ncbi:hypothetical protein DLAC_07564 [Tieghemostelium lacteum]|uniref:VASt domain-containing protein n=1 Tax=Tieghemostelium lacteum TaxID=361077 RepID=A0A151ZCU0_TIELA|nr:hypothetical protein DLAC_07564 [Tieghemostelium lacteum]|eukprot:KYQ91772.1 hypothetical protein DLAC_07564 [Tieghemostelium lacteum]